MAMAHTEHTGSLGVFKDHGEEFRRFRSKSSICRHGKGHKKSVVSLDNGLNVRVSFLPISAAFRPAIVRPWESATRLFKLDWVERQVTVVSMRTVFFLNRIITGRFMGP